MRRPLQGPSVSKMTAQYAQGVNQSLRPEGDGDLVVPERVGHGMDGTSRK